MEHQQQNPRIIGFPPFLTSSTILVLSPIAHIAIAMKNLASHFIAGTKAPEYATVNPLSGSTPTSVVTIAAPTNHRMNHGNIYLKENPDSPEVFAFRARWNASTRVMGIIARVRVSFTVTAAESIPLV